MKFQRGFVVAGLLSCNSLVGTWGAKNDEDEPKMPKGKDAADLARMGFARAAGDMGMMRDLMEDLKDPETMKEVEKLMKDKKFIAEVDKHVGSKEWEEAYGEALKFLTDPEAMAKMQAEAEDYAKFLANGPGMDGARDAHLGMETAARAALDPNFMKDALEMLKDPEMVKQMEAVMKNPEFAKEMEKVMNDPAMKEAMKEAGKGMEEMMKDPEAMKEAQEQIQAMMASIKA